MGTEMMAGIRYSVTPANAGVSCGKRTPSNREIPAFAGMTI